MAKFGGLRGAIAAPKIGRSSSLKTPKGFGGGPERSGASFSAFSRPSFTPERIVSKNVTSVSNKLQVDSSGNSIGPRLEKSALRTPGNHTFLRPTFALREYKSRAASTPERPKASSSLGEKNVGRYTIQAPSEQTIPQTNSLRKYESSPVTEQGGNFRDKLSPAQVGTLLEQPHFKGVPQGVDTVSKFGRESVRIIPDIARKIVTNPERRVSEIKSIAPDFSRITAELNAISRKRETNKKDVLKNEIENVGIQQESLVKKVSQSISEESHIAKQIPSIDRESVTVSSQIVHSVTIPLTDTDPHHAQAWSGKLKDLVQARAELGTTAHRTKSVSFLRGKLRQGMELIKEKRKNAFRFFVVKTAPIMPIDNIDEENKKRKERFAILKRNNRQTSQVDTQQYYAPVVAKPALEPELKPIQVNQVATVADIAPQLVINQQQQEIVVSAAAVTNSVAVTQEQQSKLQASAQRLARGQLEVIIFSQNDENTNKYVVDKVAKRERLKLGEKAIAYAASSTNEVNGATIAAIAEKEQTETVKSQILHGTSLEDGSFVALLQQVAKIPQLHKKQVFKEFIQIEEVLPPVAVEQEGKKVSNKDVERVVNGAKKKALSLAA